MLLLVDSEKFEILRLKFALFIDTFSPLGIENSAPDEFNKIIETKHE